MSTKPRVSIVMGSDSDLDIMRESAKALEEFGIEYEIDVTSAHRSPERTAEFARKAASRGIRVIIAGAGGAAHLAGVIAAHTTLPVIGVPIPSTSLQGMDSLLATVQMPAGIPLVRAVDLDFGSCCKALKFTSKVADGSVRPTLRSTNSNFSDTAAGARPDRGV